MTTEELFLSHLERVERVLRFIARRNAMSDAEAEEFGGLAKMKLIENDYAILRKFEGRSSLSSYLAVCLQRIYLDHRTHLWGRWRPSAVARRLGAIAVALETLTHRDGKSFDEAAAILEQRERGAVDRATIAALYEKLPHRAPRTRTTPLDEIEGDLAVAREEVEERLFDAERRASARRTGEAMQRALDAFDAEERVILRMRFEDSMSVADIARAMHLDQKALYKRFDRLFDRLRASLLAAGIRAEEVRELIGRNEIDLSFAFGAPEAPAAVMGKDGMV